MRGELQVLFFLLGLLVFLDLLIAPEESFLVNFFTATVYCGGGMILAVVAFIWAWADAGLGGLELLVTEQEVGLYLRQDPWLALEYLIEGPFVYISTLGVNLANSAFRMLEVVPSFLRSLVEGRNTTLKEETPDIPGSNWIKVTIDPFAIYVLFELKLDFALVKPHLKFGFNFFSYGGRSPLAVWTEVSGTDLDQAAKLELNINFYDAFLGFFRGISAGETPESYFEKVKELF